MTWGSSHAQLPRTARPCWCQRGWSPCRSSEPFQKKKERHGKVLVDLLTLCRLAQSVQVTTSSMKVESPGLIKTTSLLPECASYVLSVFFAMLIRWCYMIYHYVRVVKHSGQEQKHQVMLFHLIKNVKACVYIQKWSAGTRCDTPNSSFLRQTRRQKSIYIEWKPITLFTFNSLSC